MAVFSRLDLKILNTEYFQDPNSLKILSDQMGFFQILEKNGGLVTQRDSQLQGKGGVKFDPTKVFFFFFGLVVG